MLGGDFGWAGPLCSPQGVHGWTHTFRSKQQGLLLCLQRRAPGRHVVITALTAEVRTGQTVAAVVPGGAAQCSVWASRSSIRRGGNASGDCFVVWVGLLLGTRTDNTSTCTHCVIQGYKCVGKWAWLDNEFQAGLCHCPVWYWTNLITLWILVSSSVLWWIGTTSLSKLVGVFSSCGLRSANTLYNRYSVYRPAS